MGSPFKKILAVLAVGSVASSASVAFVACSDDGTGGATTTNDAGNDGGGNSETDGGGGEQCADAGARPARTCTSAACTTENGEPSVCVADKCVKLKSDECTFVSGAIDDDDAVVIGSLLDLKGSDKAAGTARQNSIELAVTEINTAGGIPTADGCGKRLLAYVSCDDSVAFNADAGATAPSRRRAARHLAEELQQQHRRALDERDEPGEDPAHRPDRRRRRDHDDRERDARRYPRPLAHDPERRPPEQGGREVRRAGREGARSHDDEGAHRPP
jgi:hypothetical protein